MIPAKYTKQLTVEGVDAQTIFDEFESIKQLIRQGVINMQKEVDKEKILTREETAKLLKVSLPTLHDWTKKKVLKAYRIGNKVRYKESEVLIALTPMSKCSGNITK